MTDKQTHISGATANGVHAGPHGLEQLIAACRRNDRAAQRKLYDGYASLIFGIIRRYTGDDSIAQEIHSDAFYRIFSRLDQYRFEGAFEGWIRRITIHSVADHFRKQHFPRTPLSEATEDVALDAGTAGPGQLAYKELLAMIHELPAVQRAVFNLFVFEQYVHKDIAALLGITENNSRWHLNDARRRLKEKITELNR